MSKFACTCGNVISDVQCPNEVTGLLLSDKSLEAFSNAMTDTIRDYFQLAFSGQIDTWRDKHFNKAYPNDLSPADMIDDVLSSKLFELTLRVMECDVCGRLWVQEKPDVNFYHGYHPDDAADARR